MRKSHEHRPRHRVGPRQGWAQSLPAFHKESAPTIPATDCGHGGVYAASNNPEVIWRHWRYFAGPRIAYATGVPNGVDVLDGDEKHGAHETLRDIWHRLPRTFTYRTGGDGGWHFQFKHHPSMRNIPQGMLPLTGFEVKSTGGYACAWWAHGTFVLDNSPPAPWPEWLLELARPVPVPERPIQLSRHRSIPPSRRFAAVIVRIESATKGERHALIHWGGRIAAIMAADRETDNLHWAIEEVASAGIRAGKDPREARRTALDGARAGLRNV